MVIDWNVVEKMRLDEQRRLSIKEAKRGVFVDNFVRFLPWHLKEGIVSKPGINLLYVADQLGLQKQYKEALNSIGYSVNDYILFCLSCCRDNYSFKNIIDYHWLISGLFDVRFYNFQHIIIESDLGKIEVYKNNLMRQKYKLLMPYQNQIECDVDKDDCHLLTYEYVRRVRTIDSVVAKTGIVNDVYGPMIHSWAEVSGCSSIDLANGYIMNCSDYDLLHKVSESHEISKDQILGEKIPHSYSDGHRLVRSLPYLMYRQK